MRTATPTLTSGMLDTGRQGVRTMTPRQAPEGITPRPRPNPIKPLGGPFRRWHLSPWKTTEATALLDDMNGGNLGEEGDTTGYDLINNLITQAGSVFGARAGGVVPYPRPGQLVPAGSGSVASTLGMSTQTMLLLGAAAVGLVLILKKR